MVLSVVDYNPSSGDFHWRWRQGRERTTLTWNSRFAFKKCSSINSDGYLMIMINGKAYPAHRLAWLIVYGTMPDGFIDHINRVRTDNRISNLIPKICKTGKFRRIINLDTVACLGMLSTGNGEQELMRLESVLTLDTMTLPNLPLRLLRQPE